MWMYTFLPQILNMTLTASIIISFVLVARLILKRAPKIFSYVLWAVVLFRLFCPVSIGSPFSFLNMIDVPVSETGSVDYIPQNIAHTEFPAVQIPVPGVSEAINNTLPQGREQLGADPLEFPMSMLTYIWILGIVVMVSYSAAQFIKLRQQLIGAVCLHHNIYLADHIGSPFVLGIVNPKIYLPSTLDAKEQSYIIQHEQIHIHRCDYIIKILAFVALCIHWFNPFVWIAFVLSGKDMEMSCDEAVMKRVGTNIRADYASSLLRLSSGKRMITGTPLAFGEGDTKSRIKNVMKYKKPAVWIVVLASITIIVLLVGLFSNPKSRIESTNFFGQFFNNNYETTLISDYEKSTKDFKAYTTYQVFPATISDTMQSVEYFYQYTDFIFDPSIQRYLECSYGAKDYENEIARLSQIQTDYKGEVKTVLYDEDKFSYPAYITIDENNHCYEYALLLGNQRIAYIFLQFINEEDVGFSKEYLPLQYEQKEDWRGYSIYLFETSNGTFRAIY